MGPQTYDLEALTPASRAFAQRLFAACPQLAWHALLRPHASAPAELQLEVPSPTGDAARQVSLWMEGSVASLEFGSWHTHADLWESEEEFFAALRAILSDRFVLWYDVAREGARARVIDLRDPEALLEELTSRYASERIRLVSWAGTADAELGLADLKL